MGVPVGEKGDISETTANGDAQGYFASQDTERTMCDLVGNLCSPVDIQDPDNVSNSCVSKLEEETKVENIDTILLLKSVLLPSFPRKAQ